MSDYPPLSAESTKAPAPPCILLFVLLVVAGLALVADQAGKGWAFAPSSEPANLVEIAPGILAGAQGRNYGAMFSVDGVESSVVSRNILTVVGSLAIGLLLRGVILDRARWRVVHAIGGGLVLAGAVGNQVDRLVLGYVRDFLILRSHPHGIFNPADVFMALGVVLLLATWWTRRCPVSAPASDSACADRGELLVGGSVSANGA